MRRSKSSISSTAHRTTKASSSGKNNVPTLSRSATLQPKAHAQADPSSSTHCAPRSGALGRGRWLPPIRPVGFFEMESSGARPMAGEMFEPRDCLGQSARCCTHHSASGRPLPLKLSTASPSRSFSSRLRE